MRARRHFYLLMLLYGFLLGCLLAGCAKSNEQEEVFTAVSPESADGTENGLSEETDTDSGSEEGAEVICVYVCGQVVCPGVYELSDGDRIFQAIQAAGGFSEHAAIDFLNQAEPLVDGEKIYVPSCEEAGELLELESELIQSVNGGAAASASGGIGADGRVNLNYATLEELETLSGIGEARAQSILLYRKEHGTFQSIEEIKNIEGIGDGIFENIRDHITV